jgi:hypothetical protein
VAEISGPSTIPSEALFARCISSPSARPVGRPVEIEVAVVLLTAVLIWQR